MERSLITESITAEPSQSELRYLSTKTDVPSPDEYIRMVLNTNYPTTIPRRSSLTYDELRLMLWRVIAYRLNKEAVIWQRDHFNTEVIQKIICWFCGLEGKVETPFGPVMADLPLNKGIWLYGLPGVGKTFLMECMSVALCACAHGRKTFMIVNMKSLERELLSKKDISILDKYIYQTWCFDDVGFENTSNIYGNEINAFEILINERYQRWERYKLITHVTSNYPMSAVGDIYDARLTRRVKAIFSEIRLNGADKTK